MMKKNQTVLITGGSSGIGLELAWVFAGGGYDLYLISRDREKLEEISNEISNKHGVHVSFLNLDLTTKNAENIIYDEIGKSGIEIEILINNAGVGDSTDFFKEDQVKMNRMMTLNMNFLTNLTRLFLPRMLERGEGKILNVASTAAFQPGPFMAVYYASKAYVLHFTEAIAEEVSDTGVFVSALCPGPTKTNFAKEANAEKLGIFNNLGVMSAKDVAETAYTGLEKNKRVIIPGIMNKLGVFATRLIPRALMTKIVKSLQKKWGKGD